MYLSVSVIFSFLFLVVSDAASVFQSEPEAEGFMLGGTATVNGEFPASAYIVTPDNAVCGATIIDASHVLTVAQCVLDASHRVYNPRMVRVNAGDIRLSPVSPMRQSRLASVIYVHNGYKPHTFENDIAVIRLQQPLSQPSNALEPAVRRSRIVANGANCNLVGWGMITATGSSINAEQQRLSIQINDRDICTNMRSELQVFESMICAGNMNQSANSAPCTGNLGSGLYCNGDLTGLLSFGINCGAGNNPPTFTQVRFFNSWIEQQVLRNDSVPLRWSPLDV
ncbi:trypsin alpha-like [Toxorhynchites rutilus septentrionalis]|uniref:trypsin alpha-like n=1 Tax=Toxorhynchites rutilus septentrionalis TaxID=329112 RepID=UPI00247A6B01|nr:trypsin alpha-like [Toxorhynchites rutilus septentrionalis]